MRKKKMLETRRIYQEKVEKSRKEAEENMQKIKKLQDLELVTSEPDPRPHHEAEKGLQRVSEPFQEGRL